MYVKQTALLNIHVLFLCLYKIYILIIFKISISISRYFQNIVSISYRNWNPDIESSLDSTKILAAAKNLPKMRPTVVTIMDYCSGGEINICSCTDFLVYCNL